MKNIKFSIVVPVYNTEKYLDECIQSALNQTYDNFELILVDDGSKDKSGEICDKYAEKDQRIKVFHKANSGMVHTRNYGIERSVGDYIISLDSDDVIVPWLLETVEETISKYNCEMVVYELERFVDNPNFEKQTISVEKKLICDKDGLYKIILFSSKYNSLCKKAIKREIMLFKDKSLKTVCYGEDLLKTLDVLQMNPKTVFTNEVLYCYRKNENSVTQKLNVEQFIKDLLYVRAESYKLIVNEQVFDEITLNEYTSVVKKLMIEATKLVCRSKIEHCKKTALLEELEQSDLYKYSKQEKSKNILSFGNKMVWFFLSKKKYTMLILMCWFSKR